MAVVRKVQDVPEDGVVDALVTIVNDMAGKFNSHQHRVDGSALSATDDLTGVPASGTATGTPAGGTAVADVDTITLVI